MNKITLIRLPIIVSTMTFSFNTIACGGDVDLSIPHIHNEHEMLFHVKNTKHSELKQMDIYQIFDGKLKNNHHKTANHDVESKAD